AALLDAAVQEDVRPEVVGDLLHAGRGLVVARVVHLDVEQVLLAAGGREACRARVDVLAEALGHLARGLGRRRIDGAADFETKHRESSLVPGQRVTGQCQGDTHTEDGDRTDHGGDLGARLYTDRKSVV